VRLPGDVQRLPGCCDFAAERLHFRSRATALSQPSDCKFAAERLQVRSRATAISQQSDCDRPACTQTPGRRTCCNRFSARVLKRVTAPQSGNAVTCGDLRGASGTSTDCLTAFLHCRSLPPQQPPILPRPCCGIQGL
jgi:hypothetical protein